MNETATTEIYTLSLHDALPICAREMGLGPVGEPPAGVPLARARVLAAEARALLRQGCDPIEERRNSRSEEHTSELQSRQYLVCRLLLETKNSVDNRSQEHLSEH